MAINTFMGSWNTFFWPFLVTSLDSMYTIQVGLKTFKFANGTLLSPMMAGAAISALPGADRPPRSRTRSPPSPPPPPARGQRTGKNKGAPSFFSLQKYFLEGVTIGAVKG